MDFSYIFKNRKLNEKKLIDFGFINRDNLFEYSSDLSDKNLRLNVVISNNTFSAEVFDKMLSENFEMLNIKNVKGFASVIQSEVFSIISKIEEQCFDSDMMVEKIKHYIFEKYGVLPESPWKDYPEYNTFKVKSGKWFGIIMSIKKNLLGDFSDEKVYVINVKLPSDIIEKIIDNNHYFRAYHMNKKYWITILLDNEILEKDVCELIDKSFLLVDKKSEK